MSSLWTPEGEHRVDTSGGRDRGSSGPAGVRPGRGSAPVPGDAGANDASDEEVEAQLAELRSQLLATPVEIVVANHAYGLFELAAIHLSERPPNFEQARLAIDALGAVVEGLAGRLGEAEASLVEALAQLRMAYVELQGAAAPEGAG